MILPVRGSFGVASWDDLRTSSQRPVPLPTHHNMTETNAVTCASPSLQSALSLVWEIFSGPQSSRGDIRLFNIAALSLVGEIFVCSTERPSVQSVRYSSVQQSGPQSSRGDIRLFNRAALSLVWEIFVCSTERPSV
ncbi:hypothetical protein RRG08_022624 [Elysia crispata]|uniref:Uncharacterized protein n=1 Tax=Elysia crispata TaxID=231223 RepID=A0AAE0Z1I7_9GAST|nr:hypothetical protein RRG08_022624 [Elysia crispata]